MHGCADVKGWVQGCQPSMHNTRAASTCRSVCSRPRDPRPTPLLPLSSVMGFTFVISTSGYGFSCPHNGMTQG